MKKILYILGTVFCIGAVSCTTTTDTRTSLAGDDGNTAPAGQRYDNRTIEGKPVSGSAKDYYYYHDVPRETIRSTDDFNGPK